MSLGLTGIVAGLISALILDAHDGKPAVGVKAADAITFSLVAVLLGLIALLAAYVSARHAVKVDPLAVLREDEGIG